MATLNGRPATAEDLLPLALTSLGHFTSMRVDAERRVRGLSMHLERLVRDCEVVWGATLDPDCVLTHIRLALEGRDDVPCTIRVTVYDPAVNMGRPVDAVEPAVLVTVRPAGELSPPPMRVRSVRYERDLPLVKHTGLFGSLHIRRTAQATGYDDALFIGPDDRVSEGVTWNIGFIDQNDSVVWPQAPVLPGVTMALLQQHAAHQVTPITLDEAKGMKAAFATNVSVGVRAISAIDHTPLAIEHPVLTTLRDAYRAIPGDTI
ncbi:aminotransferase class IV family protein [Streptomyces sp. LP05-1]|uniref:Aminotransferase class IV family protein n=1 Tax=Streptomyces pyxinae TaxID=2970734 RepID=A0ABT2CEU6_9ACTN|nr:aminotransferase class IV family protein [Streptomyces sp. LP05-1]MCS0635935.1 aminotransferase class IV family protein [Streptomyces sp. LP05-1]